MVEGLFTWPADSPQLIASRCLDCRELCFPQQSSCPACTGRRTEPVTLSRRGTLWTWTIQHFPPPLPFAGDTNRDAFQPFGVGYVELPEGIRIEGRLTECDPARLRIGQAMELDLEPFRFAAQGVEKLIYVWRPVAGAGETRA